MRKWLLRTRFVAWVLVCYIWVGCSDARLFGATRPYNVPRVQRMSATGDQEAQLRTEALLISIYSSILHRGRVRQQGRGCN